MKEGQEKGRYNIPVANEVAAIFLVDAAGEIPEAKIVVHQKKEKELRRVNVLWDCLEPMTYPLFYPFGTKGWNEFLKDKNGKRISLCDYTSYKLAIREIDPFVPIHHGKMLFQKWLVDQYTRIEINNLNFIRNN